MHLADTSVNANGTVWRWISLKDYSFPIIQSLRVLNPDSLINKGLEWNVHTLEHTDAGIVAYTAKAISDFVNVYDQSDKDSSRIGIAKTNKTHQDAVAGATWFEENYA